MTPFHEKLFFGWVTLTSSSLYTLGAILTTGESRWIYVTLAASSMTSGFLALMFKKADESVKLLVGRCGFSILGGILATRPIVHNLGFQQLTDTDIISLGGLSSLTCVGTFFLAIPIMKVLEKAAPDIAAKWMKKFTP